MPTYFKPLRRKIGIITLVMACVLMAGWVRTHWKFDFVSIDGGSTTYRAGSTLGSLRLLRITPAHQAGLNWITGDVASGPIQFPGERCVDWYKEFFGGFEIGVFSYFVGPPVNGLSRYEIFVVPYWSIVLPLTLLSAWLLLSKPTRSKSITAP